LGKGRRKHEKAQTFQDMKKQLRTQSIGHTEVMEPGKKIESMDKGKLDSWYHSTVR
jgi:hypothetical protein